MMKVYPIVPEITLPSLGHGHDSVAIQVTTRPGDEVRNETLDRHLLPPGTPDALRTVGDLLDLNEKQLEQIGGPVLLNMAKQILKRYGLQTTPDFSSERS